MSSLKVLKYYKFEITFNLFSNEIKLKELIFLFNKLTFKYLKKTFIEEIVILNFTKSSNN